MNPSPHLYPRLRRLADNRPLMAAAAALLAFVMLAVYVDLLYGQVARGEAQHAAARARVLAAAQPAARPALMARAEAKAGSAQDQRLARLR